VPTQERSEATRQAILKAARAVFLEQGYQAASVAEICARADVSKGAFYHHFETKQGLFLTLMEAWLAGIDRQLQALRAESPDMGSALLRVADMAGEIFDTANDQVPMFLEFWSEARHDRAVWQALVEPYRRYEAVFTEWMKEGMAQGVIRKTDPRDAARTLVALSVGLLLQGLLDPAPSRRVETPRHALHLLMDGLREAPG